MTKEVIASQEAASDAVQETEQSTTQVEPTQQTDSNEEQAREQGWKPVEEYDGD